MRNATKKQSIRKNTASTTDIPQAEGTPQTATVPGTIPQTLTSQENLTTLPPKPSTPLQTNKAASQTSTVHTPANPPAKPPIPHLPHTWQLLLRAFQMQPRIWSKD